MHDEKLSIFLNISRKRVILAHSTILLMTVLKSFHVRINFASFPVERVKSQRIAAQG